MGASPAPPCGREGSGRSCGAAGWAEAAGPPQGCSPLSGRVLAAQLEAEVGGTGCGEDREWEGGGEAAARGSAGPFLGGRERECEGDCADEGVKWGCGSGRGGRGPWSRSLVRRSGCAGTEREGTHQGGTTGDWAEAPGRRS